MHMGSLFSAAAVLFFCYICVILVLENLLLLMVPMLVEHVCMCIHSYSALHPPQPTHPKHLSRATRAPSFASTRNAPPPSPSSTRCLTPTSGPWWVAHTGLCGGSVTRGLEVHTEYGCEDAARPTRDNQPCPLPLRCRPTLRAPGNPCSARQLRRCYEPRPSYNLRLPKRRAVSACLHQVYPYNLSAS